MIVYSLSCKNGHAFEGWFHSSTAFDDQSKDGKLVCPFCDTHKIAKAPMAPSVRGTKTEAKVAAGPNEVRKMQQFMTGLRKYVTENAEYVGPRFAEEARKIHYGEKEDRHIYGEATINEAKELVDEGVDVAPLPPDINEAN